MKREPSGHLWLRSPSWPTIVKGNPKVPFSIVTTLRCRRRNYSFPLIASLTLDLYLRMLSVKQGGIKYHFMCLWYDSTCGWTLVSQVKDAYIYIYIKRHIRSSGRAIYHDLLIWYHLYVAWTSGPVVEFRLLHTVVVGSISSGGDHGVHCWDLIRSKQLFSAPYVMCRCVPDFLVMVISNLIYQFLHS